MSADIGGQREGYRFVIQLSFTILAELAGEALIKAQGAAPVSRTAEERTAEHSHNEFALMYRRAGPDGAWPSE